MHASVGRPGVVAAMQELRVRTAWWSSGRLDWRLVPLSIGIVILAAFLLSRPMPLYDAIAYWKADWSNPYAVSGEGEKWAYLYSPAFLQLIWPLRTLPWEGFAAAWVVLTALTLIAITRHWLPVAMFVPVTIWELENGNIHFMLALAIYLGFRYPAAWSFVFLTKVTPGVGVVWFAVRREWRALGLALGATVAVMGVSFVSAPTQWFEWFQSLFGNARQQLPYPLFPVPLWMRLVAATALIAWGAKGNRRWTMIVGTTLAIPTLWPANLAMLVGLPVFSERLMARRPPP